MAAHLRRISRPTRPACGSGAARSTRNHPRPGPISSSEPVALDERAHVDAFGLREARRVVVRAGHIGDACSPGRVETLRLTAAAPVGEGYEPVQEPVQESPPGAADRWKRRAVAWGPIAAAVAFLAQRTIAAVLARVGHAGATLDDAYIRAPSTPARSPRVTRCASRPRRPRRAAPRASSGRRSWRPSGRSARATRRSSGWPGRSRSWRWGRWRGRPRELTERLAGRTAAVGAAAMTLAFSGFLWSAASGMEVVPFAWAIARAARRASEWSEAPAGGRTARFSAELVALAWIAALFRPEGALTAGFVAATLAVFPPPLTPPPLPRWRARGPAVAACAAVVAVPLLLLGADRVAAEQHDDRKAARRQPGHYPVAAGGEACWSTLGVFTFLTLLGRRGRLVGRVPAARRLAGVAMARTRRCRRCWENGRDRAGGRRRSSSWR